MVELSYSSMGFNDRDLEAALDGVAAAGFSNVEILGMEPHLGSPPEGEALQQFRGRLSERGITGCTVHAPMRECVPGAPEEGWRVEKVGVLSTYLRFVGAIGARGLIIHPVSNPIFVDEPTRPELPQIMADAARRSMDELVPVAQEAGARMLLENLPYATQYDCSYPLLKMDELRGLVDEYPEDALGLVVDTGHAWTSGIDPASEIRTAGSRLGGTHLQDVDYDDPQDNHWAPTHGGLDWGSIRAALGEVGYSGHWTFEVINPRHGETPEALARATRETADAWGSE